MAKVQDVTSLATFDDTLKTKPEVCGPVPWILKGSLA